MIKNQFWGKLSRGPNGDVSGWHSLFAHSADVAACVEVLLTSTILNRRLAKLGGLSFLSSQHIARLSVIAALHDIGKFNSGFQAKCDLSLRSKWEGHQKPILDLFGSQVKEEGLLYEALDLEKMLSWAFDQEPMLRLIIATICHHGKPLICTSNPQTYLWKPFNGLNPFEGLKMLRHFTQAWFAEAFIAEGDVLPSNSEFHHGFAGVVMLADWMGSTVKFFPFDNGYEEDRMPFAREMARKVIKEMGVNPARYRENMSWNAERFSDIFGFSPRPCQEVMGNLPIPLDGSISILEGETGTGKTEAALARFFSLFKSGVVDGLYFALPTRTAATQMYSRICKIIKQSCVNEEPYLPVHLAVPGYIHVDGKVGERILTTFDVLWDDDQETMNFRGWASENPKRFLAGSIIVGTIDQILLSTLQVKHAHMRSACLLRHLIVVDEVHASDAYMNRLLEDVLSHHIKAGGHALLMSATLGCSARLQFKRLFIKTSDPGFHEVSEDYEKSCCTPYPLVTCHEIGKESQAIAVHSNAREKEVQMTLLDKIDRPQEIVKLALEAAQKGAKVLIIRNTVQDAIQTQLALEEMALSEQHSLLFQCENRLTLHHARFAKIDRESLDHAIELSFGKERQKGGCVAVATQTVQQSLDLDADLMITDLCPIDIFLQRIGRLHRHDRSGSERPLEYRKAQAVVLIPEENLGQMINIRGVAKGKYGFGTVYEDLAILQATWEVLQSKDYICIPSMNRLLVEEVLHPTKLQNLILRYGEPWIAHHKLNHGRLYAHKSIAKLNMINRKVFFGEPDSLFPETIAEIKTRLGEGDVQVSFSSPFDSPFKGQITTLTIPGWQIEEIPEDTGIKEFVFDNDRVYFSFGNKQFIYDRLGLRLNSTDNIEGHLDV
ncbi:hypothetical protein PNK_1123 [Candidatus Protochlamydia naegleriophila]|uniref:CRISPR-associated helicase Cas3 n=1 Tax=Candidatus Protochlamydia naegleriophila TaxID=389348 RepID=A0A0U5JD77_9BACT|nr:CRISPR-associated helicase/endonuclease Cas3 [Candidatus Protochlamydia naegleriophila]CUI16740.1 hypothetical protein PNK_1123 [Candidatus Protochlamydia naegleriophila]